MVKAVLKGNKHNPGAAADTRLGEAIMLFMNVEAKRCEMSLRLVTYETMTPSLTGDVNLLSRLMVHKQRIRFITTILY